MTTSSQYIIDADHVNVRRLSPVRNLVAGSIAGMFSMVAGQPLDMIKVRLQAMAQTNPGHTPPFTGPLDCLMKTIRSEGARGLYKGMLAPVLIAAPASAVTFYSLSIGKRLQLDEPNQEPTIAQYFKAGVFCGFCIAFLVGPAERIKCLLQVQSSSGGAVKYNGPLDCLRHLYREERMRGVFRGIGITLVRDTFGNGVWYMTYEGLLGALRSRDSSRDEVGTISIMFAGGTAGLVFWGLMYPIDMVKTRFQIATVGLYPRGARDVLKQVLQNEGIKALYRGYVPGLMRAVIGHIALFVGYEFTMKAMNAVAP